MIHITIPANNILEREYCIGILFEVFLGLDYDVTVDTGSQGSTVTLENGAALVIEDHFFNRFPEDLQYLKPEAIPSEAYYHSRDVNQFIPNPDIPVFYGSQEYSCYFSDDGVLHCGIDLFASVFFMLTRWEETVKTQRDRHDRFPAAASLAFKNGFLHRSVVNEYVEMLWNMLKHLGVRQERKQRTNRLFLTHDIDTLRMWQSPWQLLRYTAADIVRRKALGSACKRITDYLLVAAGMKKDPFDTYDWLMDLSEEINVRSRFYFMSGGRTSYDNQYEIHHPETVKVIRRIQERGHIVGIHPSYDAHQDGQLFAREKAALEAVCQCEITEGRQHYLRFSNPVTWRIWEENGMEVDSTCGYADRVGFRCGTGDAFPVFDILARAQLRLQERPLVVMDGTLFDYQNLTTDEALVQMKELISTPASMTILWHNSFLRDMEFYERIMKMADRQRELTVQLDRLQLAGERS